MKQLLSTWNQLPKLRVARTGVWFGNSGIKSVLAMGIILACPVLSAPEEGDQRLEAIIAAQAKQIELLSSRLNELEARLAQVETTQESQDAPMPVADRQDWIEPPSTEREVPRQEKSSEPPLAIYGYVKLDAIYSSKPTEPSELAYRVAPDDGTGKDSLILTARETRLGVRTRSEDWGSMRMNAVVETDFYGASSTLRLRLAHLVLESEEWRFLAGKNWDSWVALPRTVNFAMMGQHGSLWSRRAQALATRKFSFSESRRWDLTMAVAENPGADSPLMQTQGMYLFSMNRKPARIGLAGQYGESRGEQNQMAMLSFNLPVSASLSLAGAAWTGRNLGSFNGAVGQTVNSAGKAIRASGGWIQTTYQWQGVGSLSVFVGADSPRARDLDPGGIRRNESIGANLFWNLHSRLIIAMEQQYLRTHYQSALGSREISGAYRSQAAAILSF